MRADVCYILGIFFGAVPFCYCLKERVVGLTTYGKFCEIFVCSVCLLPKMIDN